MQNKLRFALNPMLAFISETRKWFLSTIYDIVLAVAEVKCISSSCYFQKEMRTTQVHAGNIQADITKSPVTSEQSMNIQPNNTILSVSV